MKIRIEPKTSTAVLAHCFTSCGYCTYWGRFLNLFWNFLLGTRWEVCTKKHIFMCVCIYSCISAVVAFF
jgi:hypothetical protein